MLWRKMLRDLWEQKGTFFSLCAIIALGISVYISMQMTISSLNQSIETYYRDYRFGDVFAQVSSMSDSQAAGLGELHGVAQVTARLTKEVRVLFPDTQENIFIRLISYEASDREALNQSYVYSGSALEETEAGIYLNPAFAQAYDMTSGSYLPVLIGGRRQDLLVVGVAQSPEYVYAVSGKSDIFPNPALFGVAIMPREQMDQLFSTTGEVNSLSFRLAAGVSYEDIESTLKDNLKRYGLIELVSRKDQISNFMLDAEVTQLNNMGRSIPIMLLLVSAAILVITLRRRAESQRGQIGVLLAFGYSNWEILWNYLTYGLVVGIAGGLLGVVFGLITLDAYIGMYQEYFTIPGFQMTVFPRQLFWAMALSVGFSMGACAFGCKDVLKLQPAEAMRPQAPAGGRRVFIEQMAWFWHMLTMPGRMALRNMARAPLRSIFSIAGVALVFAMMAVVFSFKNVMDIMITDQFQKVETYDIKVTFSQYQDNDRTIRELTGYPGVDLVETVLEIPGQLRNNNITVDRVMIGLAEDARLMNLIDKKGRYHHPAGDGAIISEELANKLEVSPGSIIYFDTSLLNDPKPIVIQQIVPQYLGSNIYMGKEALWRLLNRGQLVSAAMLLSSQETVAAFKDDYKLSEKIRGISRPDDTFAAVADYMGSYVLLIYLMGLMVSVVGFAIVYNSAMISFSERSRELASLSVLGLYDQEVAEVVSFEQWLLSFVGIILGIPLTYFFNWSTAASVQNDVYSMPQTVPFDTILLASAVTCLYLYLAQLLIGKKIRALQIVEVLKERE